MSAWFICFAAHSASATFATEQGSEVHSAFQQSNVPKKSLETHFSDVLQARHYVLASIVAIAAGLFTAASPCIYPLIPITLGVLGTRHYGSIWHGLAISSVYVGGMVVFFSALGVSFAYLGNLSGAWLSNPFVTAGLAILFLIMAMSLWGAFSFSMPAFVTRLVAPGSERNIRSVFLMGLVAGIIAAPCTGPVLATILGLIAFDGNVAFGTYFMVLYAIGIGLPFLVLGTFSSLLLRIPKSGAWLLRVKVIMGILVAAVAWHYLNLAFPIVFVAAKRLIHNPALLSVIFIALGLFLGALRVSFARKSPREVGRVFGALLVSFGLALLVHTAFFAPAGTSQQSWIIIDESKVADVDRHLAQAKQRKMPVIIDFYADWCTACKELDAYVFSDAMVQQRLDAFVRIRIDATRDSSVTSKLQARFDVVGLPTLVLIDGAGTVQKDKVIGYVTPLEFLRRIAHLQ